MLHHQTGNHNNCRHLLQSIDWNAHPFGPQNSWRPELNVILQIVLDAKLPMFVLWGDRQIILYNDACASLYGARHPHAFAKPFRETVGALWPQIEPDVSRAFRGVSAARSDVEFTITRHGYPELINVSFSYTPVRLESGAVAGMFASLTETTGAVALQRQRERERGRLNSIFETALGSVAVTSGPDHIITYRNAEFDALIGHRDVIGLSVDAAFPEIKDHGFSELLDQVFESGVAHVGRGAPTLLQRTPGGPLEERVVDFLFHPIPGPDQQTEGIFMQSLDVTENYLLNKELGHRLKNQLAIVLSLVNQSFRGAANLEQVRHILAGRISTLARAHDAAISGNQLGATVEGVIRNAVEWHNPERLHMHGPKVPIAERQALSLALIMHELVTNAIKYGALAHDAGRVEISWTVSDCEGGVRLEIVWSEVGGAKVKQPEHKGSGVRLIKSGLSGARNSSVDLTFPADGVRCEISAELPGPSGAFAAVSNPHS